MKCNKKKIAEKMPNKILLDKKELLNEHKKLIPMLKKVNPEEASEQKKEMKKFK